MTELLSLLKPILWVAIFFGGLIIASVMALAVTVIIFIIKRIKEELKDD